MLSKLEELDSDLTQHVHLENNIYFQTDSTRKNNIRKLMKKSVLVLLLQPSI
jgi:hypothetical protein